MNNDTRFALYIKALENFSAREGHSRCPAIHVEIVDGHEVFVGAWIGYMRQRYKKGVLSAERVARLEAVKGWHWGPLKPGPATNKSRNLEIIQMREQGQTLRQIADLFDLSRQRVHQIVKRTNA